jgi:hypothetical protein
MLHPDRYQHAVANGATPVAADIPGPDDQLRAHRDEAGTSLGAGRQPRETRPQAIVTALAELARGGLSVLPRRMRLCRGWNSSAGYVKSHESRVAHTRRWDRTKHKRTGSAIKSRCDYDAHSRRASNDTRGSASCEMLRRR